MRYLCPLLIALVLGITPFLSSCRVRTPDSVHTEGQSDREQRIGSLLKDYDRRIKELTAKIGTGGSVREELARSLDDLRKKQQEAAAKLEDLRNAPNTKWKKANAELQITLDELKKAFDTTREQVH